MYVSTDTHRLPLLYLAEKCVMEMPGFEPGASYMRSKRSTTELHPPHIGPWSEMIFLLLPDLTEDFVPVSCFLWVFFLILYYTPAYS